jgi:hypothetical protein
LLTLVVIACPVCYIITHWKRISADVLELREVAEDKKAYDATSCHLVFVRKLGQQNYFRTLLPVYHTPSTDVSATLYEKRNIRIPTPFSSSGKSVAESIGDVTSGLGRFAADNLANSLEK